MLKTSIYAHTTETIALESIILNSTNYIEAIIKKIMKKIYFIFRHFFLLFSIFFFILDVLSYCLNFLIHFFRFSSFSNFLNNTQKSEYLDYFIFIFFKDSNFIILCTFHRSMKNIKDYICYLKFIKNSIPKNLMQFSLFCK